MFVLSWLVKTELNIFIPVNPSSAFCYDTTSCLHTLGCKSHLKEATCLVSHPPGVHVWDEGKTKRLLILLCRERLHELQWVFNLSPIVLLELNTNYFKTFQWRSLLHSSNPPSMLNVTKCCNIWFSGIDMILLMASKP